MKYPNSRYAHLAELLFYMRGMSAKDLAKTLKRSENTIKKYLSGEQKIPFWIPELLRLKEMEFWHYRHQAGIEAERLKLGRVKGDVIVMAKYREQQQTASVKELPAQRQKRKLDLQRRQQRIEQSPYFKI